MCIKSELDGIIDKRDREYNTWADENPIAASANLLKPDDFLDPCDVDRIHDLKLKLPSFAEEKMFARERLKLRIANRRCKISK